MGDGRASTYKSSDPSLIPSRGNFFLPEAEKEKMLNFDYLVTLVNGTSSTGTTNKWILYSLFEWKGPLFPKQIGPTDGTDDISTPTLQQQF